MPLIASHDLDCYVTMDLLLSLLINLRNPSEKIAVQSECVFWNIGNIWNMEMVAKAKNFQLMSLNKN